MSQSESGIHARATTPRPRGRGLVEASKGRHRTNQQQIKTTGKNMIPDIALMIAIYGTARLLNDGLKRHPQNTAGTILTWVLNITSAIFLILIAGHMQLSGIQMEK